MQEITDEILGRINKFTHRELKADEVYCFPIILCDNEIDRDNGLQYKINYFMRGCKSFEVVYKGFNGEDINDAFLIQTNLIVLPSKNISAVNISGNSKGIFTKLTAYVDNYNNI